MQCVYLTQLSRKMESTAASGCCHGTGSGGQGEWKLEEHLWQRLFHKPLSAKQSIVPGDSRVGYDIKGMKIIFSNILLWGGSSQSSF